MITDTVCLKLYKGNVAVVSRASPYSLYSITRATFEEDPGAYNQKAATGFIKLNAVRLRLLAERSKRIV
jgi:argininosuccinate synthase